MCTEEKNSILIVDDEDINLRLLANILRKDYTVYTADNGQSAIETAIEKLPDLILLDVLMPDMNGYEVRAMLKKNDTTQKIPVIFITGLDSKEDEEKGLAMDAADYISKPFGVGIVKLRVKNQIQIINQIRTIEKLSLIDRLTGIPNRRSLDDRIEMEWGRALREHLPLSLMMIDIDKFKLFNDTYGHHIGDQVLRIVAGSFALSLKRPGDFAARYGGEEFSILLPDSDIEGAAVIAEKIRASTEQLVIPCGDDTTTKVTISIGVHSLVPTIEDAIADLFSKADQALYAAKESGRNKVCRYDIAIDGQSKAEKTDEAKKLSLEKTEASAEASVEVLIKEPSMPAGIMESLKKIDCINVDAGMVHYQGMTELYCETMYYVTKKIPKHCEAMEGFLRAGDMRNFCISVHSMKSSLAAVGAMGLSSAAAKLEEASKNNEAEYCQNEYPGFKEKLLAMHKQLAPLFQESTSEKQKKPGDPAFLKETVQKALAAIENFENDKATGAVKAALQYDFGVEVNAILKAALEELSDFNLDAAAISLKKI